MVSEEGLVSLLDVEQFDVSVANLEQHSEVVVVGEVPGLHVSLVESLIVAEVVGPDFFDVGVGELFGDLDHHVRHYSVEVSLEDSVDFDDFVSHA